MLRGHHAMFAYVSCRQFLSQESSASHKEASMDSNESPDGSEPSRLSDDDANSLPESVVDYDLDRYVPEDLSVSQHYVPEEAQDAADVHVELPEVSAPEAETPASAPAPGEDDSSSSGGSGNFPGHAGPRFYALAGNSWTPC